MRSGQARIRPDMRVLSVLLLVLVVATACRSDKGDSGRDQSPTGRIEFTSSRDGDDDIYVMNADGSDQMRLTTDFTNDSFPAWSPDCQLIARPILTFSEPFS